MSTTSLPHLGAMYITLVIIRKLIIPLCIDLIQDKRKHLTPLLSSFV